MDTFKLQPIYMYVVIVIIIHQGLVLKNIYGQHLSKTDCYKGIDTKCPYSHPQCEGSWYNHPQTCNTAESICQGSIDDCMTTSDSDECQPSSTRIEEPYFLPIVLTCDVPSTYVYIQNIEYVRFHGTYYCDRSNYQGQCTNSCETSDCCPRETQTNPDTKECKSNMQQNMINNFNNMCQYESLNKQCTISISQYHMTTCDQFPDLDVSHFCTRLHGSHNETYCWAQRVNVNYTCEEKATTTATTTMATTTSTTHRPVTTRPLPTTTATTTMATTTSTTHRPDTTRPLPTTAATTTIVTSTTYRPDTNRPLPTTTAPMSSTKAAMDTMETIGTTSTIPDNVQMSQGLVIGLVAGLSVSVVIIFVVIGVCVACIVLYRKKSKANGSDDNSKAEASVYYTNAHESVTSQGHISPATGGQAQDSDGYLTAVNNGPRVTEGHYHSIRGVHGINKVDGSVYEIPMENNTPGGVYQQLDNTTGEGAAVYYENLAISSDKYGLK